MSAVAQKLLQHARDPRESRKLTEAAISTDADASPYPNLAELHRDGFACRFHFPQPNLRE